MQSHVSCLSETSNREIMICQFELEKRGNNALLCNTIILLTHHPLPALLFNSVLLPADKHLLRVEGVGCHDPWCHFEQDCVCENWCVRDPLLRNKRLRHS